MQCTPSPFFCAPMYLCTHALHEMARVRGDLIQVVEFRTWQNIDNIGDFVGDKTMQKKKSAKNMTSLVIFVGDKTMQNTIL